MNGWIFRDIILYSHVFNKFVLIYRFINFYKMNTIQILIIFLNSMKLFTIKI